MEANTTFADFITHVKRNVAHVIMAFFSTILGPNASDFLAEEAFKTKTKPDDPRFLVNVLAKRWKQDFEHHIPYSAKLPVYFDKIRNLFNIDAHSGQESWIEINYCVENLLAGLAMFQTFPAPYSIDTSDALASIKELWNRVDKSSGELNSGVKWDANLEGVNMPGLNNDDLSVIMTQVADSVTADLVESTLDLTLGITPTSCKKLADCSFEVTFSNTRDLNSCLSEGLRVKNKQVTIHKKQVPSEVKYIIRQPSGDIPIDVIKNGIEVNLDISVLEITKNSAGELEIVFPAEVNFEKEEVTVRRQKILLERKISASSTQNKILVYGTLNWDAHKIEEALDKILDVKCNAVKSEDHPELAVLILCKDEDLTTVFEHNNKKLTVANSILHFAPYCEHAIQIVKIPIGTKSEHIICALDRTAAGCQLVYCSDKSKTGFIHCPSVEVKERLLGQKKLSLLAAKPAFKPVSENAQQSKPAPLPVSAVSAIGGTTPSFTDSNKFVSVIGGNGMTEITFLERGDLPRMQAKGFDSISTICDAKSIKYTIIDGNRLQLATAVPADVKAIMNAIQGQLQDRIKDRTIVGEIDRSYTLLFKLIAKHFNNTTNCVVTISSTQGKVNNQMDFVTIFLFGFKADIEELKQLLVTMKHPCSQEYNVSEEDMKIIADIPEALELLKTQYFVDVVLKDKKVTIRALSTQHRDEGWQAVIKEIKKRKESTILSSAPCILDYFDNYMRSDFQEAMFQKQLKGVTIQTHGDRFIFNGVHSVGEKVKAELQETLAKLTVNTWHEKIDCDLARQVFAAKKIQQILRENEVSYFFPGKARSGLKKPERPKKKPAVDKQPQDRNIQSPVRRNKERNDNSRANTRRSNTNIRKNKNQSTNANRNGKDTPHHLTTYFQKNMQLREISFVCQDATKLTKCLNQLKAVLLIQSAPLTINYTLKKFIVQNIRDIESKYKVIVRQKQYTVASSDSESEDSDSNSGSDSDSDDSNKSDTRSSASSDAFSDAPKKALGTQCYVTGMARNTIKAMNCIKDYEKNLSCQQTYKLPPLQFMYVEKYKKSDVKMMSKKYNVDVTWPVHTFKPAASPSKSTPKRRAVVKNALFVTGKKGDVEEFGKELNLFAQSIQEKSIQVTKDVPFPLLRMEKEDLEEKLNVIFRIIKATTSPSDDISDNDSDDDDDKPVQAQQNQHKIIVGGADLTVVSDACRAISGPYVTEVLDYSPQQFNSLFKDFVVQKQISSFQTENTVFMHLDKPTCKITIQGRKVNVDAAQSSIQIRLNGKFSVETIIVPKKFDYFMKKNKSLFDARQQGAKVNVKPKGDQTELAISGDRNNVLALKAKLEDLKNRIAKDLYTVTNDTYQWKVALVESGRTLQQKYNVWTESVESKAESYDCGSIHLINNVVIHLKKGDIFKESGSAVVSCDNEDMKAMGGIAKPIADKAGTAMHNQVASYLSRFGKLMVGTAMTTVAGDLVQFQHVIHIVGPIWSGGSAHENTLLCSAIRSVIDQAAKNNMTKIVLPSISTGVFKYPKKLAAVEIARELVQSLAHNPASLREVVLIDLDDEMINELRAQFEALHKEPNAKTYVDAKNQWFWLENNNMYVPYDPDQNNQIELAYQTNQASVQVVGDLNQVKNGSNYCVDFKAMRQRNLLTNWERQVTFQPLPPNKWVKLDAPSLQASVGLIKKLHFNARPSTGIEVVQITGLRNDVHQAVAEINNYIAALTQSVQMDWHGGALDAKQTHYLQQYGVTVTIDKRKITLNGLPDALDKARLLLIEQTMHSVKYPDHWDDQNQECQLFVVDAQSQEWASVASQFRATMQGARVIKVERIQNKAIWEDFWGHVQKLRKMGNAKQLKLFHGTRNTSPQLIYTDTVGFRNQFSSPQCYWGYGNYFAVNSSYSHNYAHHLSDGSKQMFLAEVLVGDPYLAGSKQDSSFRVPPLKPTQNGDTAIRYDSVEGFTAGSTVYILYENGRAYPAYLITYQ
jgi:O-acetyl-ADP-ribose deacetylase (regulator of RNase III)